MRNKAEGWPDPPMKYPDGKTIKAGDKVLLWQEKEALIEEVFQPKTQAAKDYLCEESGGALVLTKDGIRLSWRPGTGDSLELLERSTE